MVEKFQEKPQNEKIFSDSLRSLLRQNPRYARGEIVIYYLLWAIFALSFLSGSAQLLLMLFGPLEPGRIRVPSTVNLPYEIAVRLVIVPALLIFMAIRNKWGWVITLCLVFFHAGGFTGALIFYKTMSAYTTGGLFMYLALIWYLLRVPVRQLFKIPNTLVKKTCIAGVIFYLLSIPLSFVLYRI